MERGDKKTAVLNRLFKQSFNLEALLNKRNCVPILCTELPVLAITSAKTVHFIKGILNSSNCNIDYCLPCDCY